jgi:hypothetical protein
MANPFDPERDNRNVRLTLIGIGMIALIVAGAVAFNMVLYYNSKSTELSSQSRPVAPKY